MSQSKIQVFYPSTKGRMVLRTGLDWDRDVEASYVSDDRTMSEFNIETHEHYFYFKPCLAGGDPGFVWAKGSNYLATTKEDNVRRIYPMFFSEHRGSFSEAVRLP